MSDPIPPPAAAPPPAQRSGCATAFMALFGVILLLPGVCFMSLGDHGALGLIGLTLSVAATALLVAAAIRKWGVSPPPS